MSYNSNPVSLPPTHKPQKYIASKSHWHLDMFPQIYQTQLYLLKNAPLGKWHTRGIETGRCHFSGAYFISHT